MYKGVKCFIDKKNMLQPPPFSSFFNLHFLHLPFPHHPLQLSHLLPLSTFSFSFFAFL